MILGYFSWQCRALQIRIKLYKVCTRLDEPHCGDFAFTVHCQSVDKESSRRFASRKLHPNPNESVFPRSWITCLGKYINGEFSEKQGTCITRHNKGVFTRGTSSGGKADTTANANCEYPRCLTWGRVRKRLSSATTTDKQVWQSVRQRTNNSRTHLDKE